METYRSAILAGLISSISTAALCKVFVNVSPSWCGCGLSISINNGPTYLFIFVMSYSIVSLDEGFSLFLKML